MKSPFVLVHGILVFALLTGCVATYNVHIIKVHEMIQDMEAIELDEPELASDLPETGIVVNNKTDTAIQLTMRKNKEQSITVPPGGSAVMALEPGSYHYAFAADKAAAGGKSKEIYIALRGYKKIVGKILYIYDVFTRQEVVKEKELEELRSR